MASSDKPKLSPKQARFVQEYLIDLNATQAAIRSGYSPKTAKAQGSRLLTNVDVSAAIAAGQMSRGARAKATAEAVIEELDIIGRSDIGAVLKVDDKGVVTVRSLDELPPHVRRCIESIKQTTREYVEGHGENAERVVEVQLQVKLHPKVAALSLLMDHHGLKAPSKHEHAGKDGGPIETANVRYVIQVPKEEPEEDAEGT